MDYNPWERITKSVGTGHVICGNRVQHLWEQITKSVGTGYVICGNRLCNLWEQIAKSVGTDYAKIYIYAPSWASLKADFATHKYCLKSITDLPVAVPHGAKVTSYCI